MVVRIEVLVRSARKIDPECLQCLLQSEHSHRAAPENRLSFRGATSQRVLNVMRPKNFKSDDIMEYASMLAVARASKDGEKRDTERERGRNRCVREKVAAVAAELV